MARSHSNATALDANYERNVFINCPFDPQYLPLFQALIFTVEICGYTSRCALEVEDSGEVRALKIIRIIKDCAFGIHDISRTELSGAQLPRFNMPYELGLFIGCTVFGAGRRRQKRALVLDRESYRYDQFLSDIAGQDIQSHKNDPEELIRKVRNWLANNSRKMRIAGADLILKNYQTFCGDLPEICKNLRLTLTDMENYRDFHNCVIEWIDANERPFRPS
jgi:hypothetical protein